MPAHLSRKAFLKAALGAGLMPRLAAAGDSGGTGNALVMGLLDDFGFSAGNRRAVIAGEVVAIEREAGADDELAGAAVMRLPTPPSAVARRLRRGLVVLADRAVIAHRAVESDAAGEAWSAAGFSDGEKGEVVRLFQVAPGDVFNLSTAEIAMVRRALSGRSPQSADAASQASASYRDVLAGRWQSYRKLGAAGLADYDRGDRAVSPAEGLRRITAADRVPAVVQPLARALDAYPAAQPPALESRFYWKKTVVNDRIAFVLSHVAVQERPGDAVLFALREYYVGHSYNVLQQLGAVVADGEGALMVAVNSTLTDRVAGPLGVIARPIGSRFARDALGGYFSTMRELCRQPER